MAAALVALVAVPAVAGALLLIAGHTADRRATRAGVGAALVTLTLAVPVAIARPTFSAEYLAGVSFGARVDGLSAVLTVTVAVVSLAVLVFSAADLAPDASRARFVGLMLVFSAGMLLTVTATTLLTLLMAWELMGATSYALIGFRWHETRPAASGAVAFLTTRAGDLGLYVAAGAALAGGASGLGLDALATLPDGWRDVVAGGVVLAALGKSAQLPFSFWLSRAMDGPSPVSALLHSAAMVAAGAYLLLRLNPLLSATGWAATLVAWTGAATALTLGAVAAVQRDLKQVLAASTCAQLGFMVLAAGAGAVAAGGAHLVTHALTKSLLFLTAGAWLTALGTDRLADLRGVGTRWPVVGATFAVGGATLAGLAPLSLWASKEHVLAGALHTSTPLYLTALAATALGAVYASRATILVLG
ncbi:proton-conducting transporter transmembrane domain-containing protein, partial [Saccharomonospora saliphila]|uniref:proton-conducting transporter transmembrane domain-containing protein n=1 Tax=Saccharomonospora saliphila TaxID=369829 RepID=UPI00037BD134